MSTLFDTQLLKVAQDRTSLLLEMLARDVLDLQREARNCDPLHCNPAEQAEAGLRLYRAVIDAAQRVAQNLDGD